MRPVFQSVLAATFLVMASAAVAGPFEDGQAAYDRHDYATAFQDWRPLADHGDAKVQNKLGNMYAQGQGVTQDYAEAVRWYRQAADQGSLLRRAISPTCTVKGWASPRIIPRPQGGAAKRPIRGSLVRSPLSG